MGVYQTSVKPVQVQHQDMPPLSYIDIMPRCLKIGNIKEKVKPTFDNFRLYIIFLFVNHFQNKPWFLRVCSASLLKTLWEKEKLLVTSNFSFFHGVFFPVRELSAIFIEFIIVVCKLYQFGRV